MAKWIAVLGIGERYQINALRAVSLSRAQSVAAYSRDLRKSYLPTPWTITPRGYFMIVRF
jgi:hypothetical protein